MHERGGVPQLDKYRSLSLFYYLYLLYQFILPYQYYLNFKPLNCFISISPSHSSFTWMLVTSGRTAPPKWGTTNFWPHAVAIGSI